MHVFPTVVVIVNRISNKPSIQQVQPQARGYPESIQQWVDSYTFPCSVHSYQHHFDSCSRQGVKSSQTSHCLHSVRKVSDERKKKKNININMQVKTVTLTHTHTTYLRKHRSECSRFFKKSTKVHLCVKSWQRKLAIKSSKLKYLPTCVSTETEKPIKSAGVRGMWWSELVHRAIKICAPCTFSWREVEDPSCENSMSLEAYES